MWSPDPTTGASPPGGVPPTPRAGRLEGFGRRAGRGSPTDGTAPTASFPPNRHGERCVEALGPTLAAGPAAAGSGARPGAGSPPGGSGRPPESGPGCGAPGHPTGIGAAGTTIRPPAGGRAPGAPARSPRGAVRADRGAATVWCVACLGLLSVVLGAVLTLAAVVEARHRAAGAADLAALAAAERAWHGPERACEQAGIVAEAGGTRLVRCGVGPGLHPHDPPGALVADLTVESRAGPHRLTARARATTG
ncbi:hypothetical protein FNQ90_15055 [Streptomyces alkaliphilus]|uniref:Putative Flp pilus-assembly TadG-like N-terminal domain-containing protein n=1 Tax=Streptomyces alkaliphilus TaxID=1472722 RepID=A0A7W3Y2F4_9ACTN|nr:hypothetical protein [Streptomyces alkaliphilus]